TLIKAWTNREKFEPGTNLRAWLFTILRNTYYTNVLRRRREVRDEDGSYAGTLKAAPTQDWSVAMRSLQVALQKLPDEHREQLVHDRADMIRDRTAFQLLEHALQRAAEHGGLGGVLGRLEGHGRVPSWTVGEPTPTPMSGK